MYEGVSRQTNIYKRFSLKSSFRYANDIRWRSAKGKKNLPNHRGVCGEKEC